jgi:hypothetical protein
LGGLAVGVNAHCTKVVAKTWLKEFAVAAVQRMATARAYRLAYGGRRANYSSVARLYPLKFVLLVTRGTFSLQTRRRVRHPHYVLGDAVGFLLVLISGFAYVELCLHRRCCASL